MFRKIINISIAFLFIFSFGFAQGSLDRSKAPKGDKPKAVTFPKFKEAKLSNGLEVIVVEDNAYPLVSISITSKGGSYYDGDKVGLSSLTSNLLTKGTASRNAMQIANEIAFLGSNLNSYSMSDGNTVTASSLKKNLNKTLDILADCILNPAFTEDEFSREIAQRLASIKRNRTEPNSLAETRFTKVIFGDEMPYGSQISGTETSLNTITPADLKSFYAKYFIPNNAFCVISGDITLKEAVALLEAKLKNWKKGESHLVRNDNSKIPNTPRVIVVNRDGAVQSAIRIGSLGVAKTNPDIRKLETLNTYLGGYYRSQLFQKLREEKSYTYGVNSTVDARLFPGSFGVRTQVGSQFTAPAIEDILDEIKKLSITPIPDERLNEVKNYLVGNFPMSIQTAERVAYLLSDLKLYGLPLTYYNNYISSIQQITKEDLVGIAKKYLDVSKMSIVISGDSKTVAPTLTKFGKVEIMDADGNPISE